MMMMSLSSQRTIFSSVISVAIILLAGTKQQVHGFIVPSPKAASPSTYSSSTTTKLDVDSTGWDSFAKVSRPIKDISYGEDSRQYRRTVYTHDDWKQHRSPDRFIYYLTAIFKSGVYKNLSREVIATTSIATAVCFYNLLVAGGGITDFAGVTHDALLPGLPALALPLTPFTLASPSLGLLLVFRTNTSYQRWDEARKNWGSNINRTRDLVRMANAYYDKTNLTWDKRQADLHFLALCTWSYVRAMKRHLSPEEEDEEAFQTELKEKLPEGQAQAIIDAAHRPNRALQDLSYAIDALPMHFLRKNEIQKSLTQFEDNLGSSERLLTSPVPVFYSRHTARFTAVWLLLLPLALYDPFKTSWNHLGMIPATAVVSVFLFGIEELATQLEEPFTILPMQAFCDKIYNWCMEIMTWAPGDTENNVPTRARPEHAYFATVMPPEEFKTGAVSERIPINAEAIRAAAAATEQQANNNNNLSFEDFVLSGMYMMDAKDNMSE